MIVKILSKNDGSSFRKTSTNSMGLMLLPTGLNDMDYSENVYDPSWSCLRAEKLKDFVLDMFYYVTFINTSIDAMRSLSQAIENAISKRIGANAKHLGTNGAGNVLYRINPYTLEKNPETLEILFDELSSHKIDLNAHEHFSKLNKLKARIESGENYIKYEEINALLKCKGIIDTFKVKFNAHPVYKKEFSDTSMQFNIASSSDSLLAKIVARFFEYYVYLYGEERGIVRYVWDKATPSFEDRHELGAFFASPNDGYYQRISLFPGSLLKSSSDGSIISDYNTNAIQALSDIYGGLNTEDPDSYADKKLKLLSTQPQNYHLGCEYNSTLCDYFQESAVFEPGGSSPIGKNSRLKGNDFSDLSGKQYNTRGIETGSLFLDDGACGNVVYDNRANSQLELNKNFGGLDSDRDLSREPLMDAYLAICPSDFFKFVKVKLYSYLVDHSGNGRYNHNNTTGYYDIKSHAGELKKGNYIERSVGKAVFEDLHNSPRLTAYGVTGDISWSNFFSAYITPVIDYKSRLSFDFLSVFNFWESHHRGDVLFVSLVCWRPRHELMAFDRSSGFPSDRNRAFMELLKRYSIIKRMTVVDTSNNTLRISGVYGTFPYPDNNNFANHEALDNTANYTLPGDKAINFTPSAMRYSDAFTLNKILLIKKIVEELNQ